MANKYIYKKTGKPYTVVTDNFMMKQNGKWIKDLILYKAEYNNPDGEYFARTKDDFYANFEEQDIVNTQFSIGCWLFQQPKEPVISAETLKFTPHPIIVSSINDNGEQTCEGEIEDYAGKLDELLIELSGKTEQEIIEFLNNFMEPYLF